MGPRPARSRPVPRWPGRRAWGNVSAVIHLDSVRFVLVRPEEAGNVGAAARVLKNFGLGHLVLVAPRLARRAEAVKWARGAEDVLEGADLVDDLPQALEPCVRAFATTRRRGRLRGSFLGARDAAGETAALARSAQPVAWVFGPESRGLTTGEVALCSTRVTIPTAPTQPSLNLAQAVAICAYETWLAAREDGPAAPRREAPLTDREALYRHLEEALLAVDFLQPHTAAARMAVLRRILERATPTPSEVRFLRGLARQVGWAGERTGRKSK
jgi:tRNA/rRNA methyltransferase